MPREPVRAARPDQPTNITLQVPGWFKNEILDLCEELDVPITRWCIAQLRAGLREGRGLPAVPPAHGTLITPEEVIRAYANGEQLLAPCGNRYPCEGYDQPRTELAGMQYCSVCSIRLG